MIKTRPVSSAVGLQQRVVIALVVVSIVNLYFLVELAQRLRPQVHSVSNHAASKSTNSSCVTLDKYHVEERFYQEDRCFSQQQILDTIRDLVFAIDETFESHGLSYFVDSGTLLGAYREKGVIKHDTDADIGVPLAIYKYLRDVPVVFPDGYKLLLWNSTLYPDSGRDDRLPGRLVHTGSGLYLDIFVYLDWKHERTGLDMVGPLQSWCFGNCVHCRRHPDGKQVMVPKYWVYPVVNCDFEGRLIKCPRHTKHFLRYMFGDTFMTPMREH